MRVDRMPLEDSLARFDMSDRAPPMAFEHARRRVEAIAWDLFEAVFEHFERREPLSSTTAYCIYRATRSTDTASTSANETKGAR